MAPCDLKLCFLTCCLDLVYLLDCTVTKKIINHNKSQRKRFQNSCGKQYHYLSNKWKFFFPCRCCNKFAYLCT
uniref:Secreted protein n=1 Tax=Mola mola TaxID=94237 RepID=A0A3Q3W0C7_MOLML